jgi:cytochrome c peroxidase
MVLGQRIFTDQSLSEPGGTACASCHQANMGFAGNHGSTIGVARGSTPGSFGLRNAMTNSYSGLVPPFHFIIENGKPEAVGGLLWDGRADTLTQQAAGPLLHPLEMNNASAQSVVSKIAAAPYAAEFQRIFGAQVFSDASAAFTRIGNALESFQRGRLQTFSSKYDAMVKGTATLSAPEARGMALFRDPARANCAGCHLMNPTSGKPEDSLFTDFSYYATGVPRNTAIPRNADASFFDLGLCGPERTPPTLPAEVLATGVTIENFCGMFRMPTLRNVAERPAFMHNGVFKDLRAVASFYANRHRDPMAFYGGNGTPNDLPAKYLGNIEKTKAPFNLAPTAGPVLDAADIDDLVAFLRTLSDGYRAP